MHKLKDYTAIVFNGGSYGTYLNFVLSNLNSIDIKEPFDINGASHNFKTNWIYGTPSENYHVEPKNNGRIAQYHPKTKESDSFIENTRSILSHVGNGILIYPSTNNILLTMNNLFYKRDNSWVELQKEQIPNLYKMWAIPKKTNINEIPKWIIREWLSLYMMGLWVSLYEWGSNVVTSLNNDNLKTILLSDLLYNFNDTILELADFLNIKYTNECELNIIHKKMMSIQQHLYKDDRCSGVISKFLNNDDFTITEHLSIVDEAWIQWELRNNGYEMYCNGMNEFPTNLHEFKEHTYKI